MILETKQSLFNRKNEKITGAIKKKSQANFTSINKLNSKSQPDRGVFHQTPSG